MLRLSGALDDLKVHSWVQNTTFLSSVDDLRFRIEFETLIIRQKLNLTIF